MTDICDECGEEFERIGQHWSSFQSHRPGLSEKSLEALTGVLMGDGCVNRSSKNPQITINMTSPNYLEYLDNMFGAEGLGVKHVMTPEESAKSMRKSGFRPNAKAENYSDLYRLSTRCNPQLSQFESWYSPEKEWPESIDLTPTVLKNWFVCDGYWANYDTKNLIAIAAFNERNNKKKIESYFRSVGLPTPDKWHGEEKQCYMRWNVDNTQTLFDYMGEPLPDFEYKFP